MQQPAPIPSQLLAGTVGVITGGAQGIGAAAVGCFASAGAKVIYSIDLVDVKNHQPVDAGSTEFIRVKVDITNADEVEALVRRVIKDHGRLDWFTRMLDVNVVGAFNCVQWAARAMMTTSEDKPISGGSIIVSTSLAASSGGMGAPAYTMSKHATTGLVRSAAVNLAMAGTGIRVNGVAPGPTATAIAQNNMATASPQAVAAVMESTAKITPEIMAAFGAPQHIGNAAVFLASNLAAGVNGVEIVVDRGFCQMPKAPSGIVFSLAPEPL